MAIPQVTVFGKRFAEEDSRLLRADVGVRRARICGGGCRAVARTLAEPVLAASRASPEDSFRAVVPKTAVHPKRIVVNGQRQEPDAIGIMNASQGLLAIRANERCAWLAFVDLLFRTAGRLCHSPVRVMRAPKEEARLVRMADLRVYM